MLMLSPSNRYGAHDQNGPELSTSAPAHEKPGARNCGRQQVSTWGCRRLGRSIAKPGQRYRAKSYSGAPRPMKMGTTRSPFPYDAIVYHAAQPAKLRHPSTLHYASRAACLPDFEEGPVYPLDSSAGIDVMCQ
jgi:hypothetical protein